MPDGAGSRPRAAAVRGMATPTAAPPRRQDAASLRLRRVRLDGRAASRHELRATGEHARNRRTETRERLTPQESQIAASATEGGRIWRLRRSCSSARAQSTTTYARYSANLAWGRVPSLLAPWLNSRKTRLLPVSGDTTRREPRLCKYWICEAGISLMSTPRS